MTSSVQTFHALVKQAYDGKLKLPAFQRKWKWNRMKVITLFDSLRQRYPIGSLLFLRQGSGVDLAPRAFESAAGKAKDTATELLVLDGQQRLTAGIHLLYGTGNIQYFLDLDKLYKTFKESGAKAEDKEAVKRFASELDVEDGYCIARPTSKDPDARLLTSHLLYSVRLTDDADLTNALKKYSKRFPEREEFVDYVVRPFFRMTDTDTVPFDTIEDNASIEAISRIFSTLNTTGQLLTPFELVVATLFPSKINLEEEVDDYRKASTYFMNMDGTGEIYLQTTAMIGGVEHKKATLPKSITATVYRAHSNTAILYLEDLGKFLTERLGLGLDSSGELITYDALFPPMAVVLAHLREKNLTGPALANAYSKIEQWFIAAALVQRYQEGVHNKQKTDRAAIIAWLDDDEKKPTWVQEALIPPLRTHSTSGAIGTLMRALENRKDIRDPVTSEKVGVKINAVPTEKHHIFPIKYLKGLPGWADKADNANTPLNMMMISRETNKRWINQNPADHINEALGTKKDSALREIYREHLVSNAAFDILIRPNKTKKDFYEFLLEREKTMRAYIGEWGFGYTEVQSAEDLLDMEDSLANEV